MDGRIDIATGRVPPGTTRLHRGFDGTRPRQAPVTDALAPAILMAVLLLGSAVLPYAMVIRTSRADPLAPTAIGSTGSIAVSVRASPLAIPLEKTPSVTARSPDQGWLLWSISTNPPAREWAALSDDPSEQGVILFGGLSAGNRALNDTWEFQLGHWNELCSGSSATPSCGQSPPARWSPGLAYDARDGELVLFGGQTSFESLNDTWVFHNGTWSNETSGSAPPNDGGEMAY